MSEPSGPIIRVPRWIQLVGLPVGLLIVWMLAGILGHVIFLFLVAAVVAFLLNPLVRSDGVAITLRAFRIPMVCWVAPEMPSATYTFGFTVLPVWPTCSA